MTTKPIAKASAKPSKKPTAQAVPSEPSLCFYHSQDLRDKTEQVFAALEAAPEDSKHGVAMADLVAELTVVGMDYYYMRALKLAKVGFVTEQSARVGMVGAVKLINSVSRKFIERMDQAQLLVVAQHIRDLAAPKPMA